jgi:hypothetical protein
MSEHVWKIGDWCERHGERGFVFDVSSAAVWAVRNNATALRFDTHDTLLKHLPDCTGWDWQPTPNPGEGWRLVEIGEVIEKGDEWLECGGKWNPSLSTGVPKLIKNPLRRRIKPKYRPFANAEEFKPHRDKWFIIKLGTTPARIHRYSDSGIMVLDANTSYLKAFERYTFEDGTPFGVEVTE